MTALPTIEYTDADLERLLGRVAFDDSGCWLWTGATTGEGYGTFRVIRDGKPLRPVAHRALWEALVEPIGTGLELDHLCRVRRCVNPDHLEPVDGHTNNMRSDSLAARRARQEACKAGHPLSGDNLYVHPKRGTRDCRQCRRERSSAFWKDNPDYKQAWRAQRRAAGLPVH